MVLLEKLMIKYLTLLLVLLSLSVDAQISFIGADLRLNMYNNSLLPKRNFDTQKLFNLQGGQVIVGFKNESKIGIGAYLYLNRNDNNYLDREIYVNYIFKPLFKFPITKRIDTQIQLSCGVYNLYERATEFEDFLKPVDLQNWGINSASNIEFQIELNNKIRVITSLSIIEGGINYHYLAEEDPSQISRKIMIKELTSIQFGILNRIQLGVNYFL